MRRRASCPTGVKSSKDVGDLDPEAIALILTASRDVGEFALKAGAAANMHKLASVREIVETVNQLKAR